MQTQQPNRKESEKGFTLVEMLVTLALAGVVLLIVSMSFLNSIRTTNRTNISLQVKQQGDFAMSEMTAMIRRASAIVSCAPGQIEIQNQDGGVTIFSLVEDGQDGPARVASNSSYLTGNQVVASDFSVTCSSTGDQITFSSISFTLEQAGELIETPVSRIFTGSAGIRKLN